MKICSIPGCGRKRHNRGLCTAHHVRRSRGKDLYAPIKTPLRQRATCMHCDRKPISQNLCGGHLKRLKAGLDMRPPLKDYGAKVPITLYVRVKPHVADRLRRRAQTRRVPVAFLVRAILDRWVMTDGAETMKEQDRTEAAWRRTGVEESYG